MASVRQQTVHTGNTILIKYNGITIGRAQGLDARRSFGTEGVYEIGSIMPQEHVQLRYEGSFTLERFLLKTTDLAAAGIAALGEEILDRDELDIEVINKLEGTTVRVYQGCTISDYSENFKTGAISGENTTVYYLNSHDGSGNNTANSSSDALNRVTGNEQAAII